MRKAWFFVGSLLFVGVVAACGGGDLGESCDKEGEVKGQCDDDLVCGKKNPASSDLACLKQCSSQADCGSTEDCYAVTSTSLKGCRPKNQ